jgi:MarC family integral membrane protein
LRAIAIGWAALPVDRQSDRDAGQFLVALAVSLGVMFPIINPLGHVPMFYVMTEQDSPAFRRLLAARTSLYTFSILIISLLLGHFDPWILYPRHRSRFGRHRRQKHPRHSDPLERIKQNCSHPIPVASLQPKAPRSGALHGGRGATQEILDCGAPHRFGEASIGQTDHTISLNCNSDFSSLRWHLAPCRTAPPTSLTMLRRENAVRYGVESVAARTNRCRPCRSTVSTKKQKARIWIGRAFSVDGRLRSGRVGIPQRLPSRP